MTTHKRSEQGSATLHVIFMSALLFTALTVATLWMAISTARHKLAAAADLTALSAAQVMVDGPSTVPAAASGPPAQLTSASSAKPCAAAARTAALNDVHLTSCEVTSTAVSVEVSLELELRIARPTLTATARAGPA